MAYESPIEKIFGEIHNEVMRKDEENLMTVVSQTVGYTVDRTELLKALQYDRQQYEKGYADAENTYKNRWIPVSKKLPKCEQKVLVLALHRNSKYVITTGLHEDGSLSECDSVFNWEEMNYEKWDDENDCGIIPEGWFEYHEYNPDGVLNYEISDEVIAWMPLPESYKESE